MRLIRFLPTDQTLELRADATLFEAGATLKVGIDTACVGKGTCGLCRVKVLAGGDLLSEFTDEERKHLGNVYHITKVRLACRTRVVADGEVVLEPVLRRKKPR